VHNTVHPVYFFDFPDGHILSLIHTISSISFPLFQENWRKKNK